MLARITEVVPGDNGTGFKIALIQSKGYANGPATVKFFAAGDDDVELTNYVRKTGDEMGGQLKITGNTKNSPLLLVQPTESSSSSTIVQFNNKDGNEILEVANNGQVFYERNADAEAEITNKKYVDDAATAAIESSLAAEIALGRKFIPTTNWNDVGNGGTTEHLYWDKSIIAWHPKDASGLDVRITASELGEGENPKFEKGNATIWGYKASTKEWRMLGCAVHDGEVHVKNDIENIYYYVSVSWKFKPTVRAADWPFVRLKLEGYW